MAAAAKITIVQVSQIVAPGEIDPEAVITPGIFVDRVVQIAGVTPTAEAEAAG
jgi:3-oxoadipate CoA-transferase alpha subunit